MKNNKHTILFTSIVILVSATCYLIGHFVAVYSFKKYQKQIENKIELEGRQTREYVSQSQESFNQFADDLVYLLEEGLSVQITQ